MGQGLPRKTCASAEALAWLKGLPWPGNIRQLKQLIERTVLVTDRTRLEAADFSLPFEMEAREAGRDALPRGREA